MTKPGLTNKHPTSNVELGYAFGVSILLEKRSEATPTFDVRSAGGGQVLARLWRVERSMLDVHLFSV